MDLDFVSVAEAHQTSGLRMVFNAGVPGPWSEGAKGILHFKGIRYVSVAHHHGMPNTELVAWTGVANAPVALYDDERARSHWSEILFLAERLAPDPPLVPTDQADRVTMMGICHEIYGEDGLGWNRRLQLLAGSTANTDPQSRMRHRYSGNSDTEVLERRLIASLNDLTNRLKSQARAGSPWFVGHTITAADIYWAAMSNLFDAMDHTVCPMPDFYRDGAANKSQELASAVSPELIAHRDRTAELCFERPMRF